jgi:hypothetical protein
MYLVHVESIIKNLGMIQFDFLFQIHLSPRIRHFAAVIVPVWMYCLCIVHLLSLYHFVSIFLYFCFLISNRFFIICVSVVWSYCMDICVCVRHFAAVIVPVWMCCVGIVHLCICCMVILHGHVCMCEEFCGHDGYV